MHGSNSDVIARWARPRVDEVGLTRDLVRISLAQLGVRDEELDNAVVMASELLSNICRHGTPPAELRIWPCALGCAVIEFRDTGTRLPVLPMPWARSVLDPLTDSGRGLALVTCLSRACCGAEPLPARGGKTVWFAAPTYRVPDAVSVGALVSARLSRATPAAEQPAVVPPVGR